MAVVTPLEVTARIIVLVGAVIRKVALLLTLEAFIDFALALPLIRRLINIHRLLSLVIGVTYRGVEVYS